MTRDLSRLLAPRSIAVVGLSSRPLSVSRLTLKALQRNGFEGRIVGINPRLDEADGVPCFVSLAAVGEPVDLALVFLPAAAVAAAVAEAARAGVGAVAVFSSGFAETGPQGRALQEELAAAAEGLVLLGPNCQGLIDRRTRVAATFSNAVAGRTTDATSRVAYVGQSGAIGGSVFDLLRSRVAPPAVWVSTGNEAMLDTTAVADHLLDDPGLDILAAYVEATPSGERWERLCSRARDLGKRLVVLRAGRSDAGRRAAASHTGSLVSADRPFELVCEKYGAVVVGAVEDFVDVVVALVGGLGPRGRRIAVASTSGGVGTLAADAAEEAGLVLADLGAPTRDRLRGLLPAFAAAQNPLDVTAELMQTAPERLGEILIALADDPEVDHVLCVLTVVAGKLAVAIAETLVEVAQRVSLSVAYVAGPDRAVPAREILAAAGVPVFPDASRALRAVARVAPAADLDARRPAAQEEPEDGPGVAVLTESAAAPLLDRYGIPRPQARLVSTRAECEAAAADLGGPLVLKVQSAQILHKTEVGGVRLGIPVAEAGGAFEAILAAVAAAAPDASVDGVLLARQEPPGLELLVGVQGPERGYPPVLTVGLGGVSVEVDPDVVTALAPVSEAEAAALLHRLRARALLAGHRGAAPRDVAAAAAVIAGFSRLAAELGDRLVDAEVNPLVVHAAGAGVCGLDASIRLKEAVE